MRPDDRLTPGQSAFETGFVEHAYIEPEAGYAVRVAADLAVVDGRVFVFAEDEMSEHAYELVAEAE
mgnify:CR=1 FL=1